MRNDELKTLVEELRAHGRLAQLEQFTQHGRITTFDHVVRVAALSLRIARRLPVAVSETDLARGALLHDYYLYDWHHCENKAHAVNHPVIALSNAVQDFELSRRERNIIASHMWPLPPTRVPQCREAWIVCVADKVCSLQETLFMR